MCQSYVERMGQLPAKQVRLHELPTLEMAMQLTPPRTPPETPTGELEASKSPSEAAAIADDIESSAGSYCTPENERADDDGRSSSSSSSGSFGTAVQEAESIHPALADMPAPQLPPPPACISPSLQQQQQTPQRQPQSQPPQQLQLPQQQPVAVQSDTGLTRRQRLARVPLGLPPSPGTVPQQTTPTRPVVTREPTSTPSTSSSDASARPLSSSEIYIAAQPGIDKRRLRKKPPVGHPPAELAVRLAMRRTNTPPIASLQSSVVLSLYSQRENSTRSSFGSATSEGAFSPPVRQFRPSFASPPLASSPGPSQPTSPQLIVPFPVEVQDLDVGRGAFRPHIARAFERSHSAPSSPQPASPSPFHHGRSEPGPARSRARWPLARRHTEKYEAAIHTGARPSFVEVELPGRRGLFSMLWRKRWWPAKRTQQRQPPPPMVIQQLDPPIVVQQLDPPVSTPGISTPSRLQTRMSFEREQELAV